MCFLFVVIAVMILGQISYLDCLVFLVFLAPQLLLNVSIIDLIICISKALPFVRESPGLIVQRSQYIYIEPMSSLQTSLPALS